MHFIVNDGDLIVTFLLRLKTTTFIKILLLLFILFFWPIGKK